MGRATPNAGREGPDGAAAGREKSRLRIAFLVGRFPSISETFVLEQITGLIDLGQDVDVFARRADPSTVVHEQIDRYRLRERISYGGAPSKLVPRLVGAMALVLRWGLRKPLVVLRALNVARYGSDASSLKLLYWAAAFLSAGGEYDVVQAHFGPNGRLALRLRDIGAIAPAARIVTAFHGYDVYRYPRQHGRDYYRDLFRRGDRFCTISQLMRGDLAALGCDPRMIVVHHMGAHVGRFAFQPKLFPSDGVLRFLSIARLVPKKGIEYAIRALAQAIPELAATGLRVEYRIVGDGPLRGALERLGEQLSLRGSIVFLGWKTHGEVGQLLAEADALLAPSVTAEDGDKEGNPVSLMESLAVGRPVFSTFHSAIPELVHDRVNGFLVPERDADALAARIVAWARDPQAWAGMAAAGREIVEREYSVPVLNRRLLALYHHVLREGPEPPQAARALQSDEGAARTGTTAATG
jgi:colanic acid/amylovoran biosynthesis glycosyltransferase